MWFIFAILSAVFAALRKVNDKQLSHDIHPLHLAWLARITALPVAAGLAIVFGQLFIDRHLSNLFWVCLLLSIFIADPLDKAIYIRTLKFGQLSKTAPLSALTPVLLLVIGAIFLSQVPSWTAIIAIFVIMLGLLAINVNRSSKIGLRNFWNNLGLRYGLMGVSTISIQLSIVSVVVSESSPLFYAFWGTLASAAVQFVYAQLLAPGQWRNSHMKLLMVNGSILSISGSLNLVAIGLGPVAYVTAVRSLSASLTAFLGARKYNEGMNWSKFVAIFLIAIGTVVLALQK